MLNCPKAVCSRVGAVPRQLHSIEKLELLLVLLLLLQVVVAKAAVWTWATTGTAL